MTLWNTLTPDQQAAIIGLVVCGLVYLGRHLFSAWFASTSNVALFTRTASAVLICGVAVLGNTIANGWKGPAAFLIAWAVAYMAAEGTHTLASRTSALTDKPVTP